MPNPVPTSRSRLTALALTTLVVGVTGCTDASAPDGEPFADLPREPYRRQLPDGRTAVGVGVRLGEHLLIDGDTLIPAAPGRPPASAAVGYLLWPSKTIYYQFTADVPQPVRDRVLAAAGPWTQIGFRFYPRTNQSNFVTIRGGFPGYTWICGATLGYQPPVEYYAGADCTTHDYVHEWGHILGLHHEHSRNDRDQYVALDPSYPPPFSDLIGSTAWEASPYDFDSVMHYDAFGRHPDGTIDYERVKLRALDGRSLFSYGWTETPSYHDLSALYWAYWTEPPCGPGTGQICP